MGAHERRFAMTRFSDMMRARIAASRYFIVAGLIVFVLAGGPHYALLAPPLSEAATGQVAGYRRYDAAHTGDSVEVTVIRFDDSAGNRQEVERVGHYESAMPLHYSRWQPSVIDLDGAPQSVGQFVFLVGVALAAFGAGLAGLSAFRKRRYERAMRRVLRR